MDQSEHLKFLVKISKSKVGLEVGTFTGYSALCMAEGLPADGKLTTLENNADAAEIAQRFFKEAGVESKIDLKLGDAKEYLAE
mmetsp:Transcript_29496/g.28649  ORF Transcript_29496/g.28649 Transcript_29496/m.28649 type:complete len:83 (+) Transcript_29496:176-424(+)